MNTHQNIPLPDLLRAFLPRATLTAFTSFVVHPPTLRVKFNRERATKEFDEPSVSESARLDCLKKFEAPVLGSIPLFPALFRPAERVEVRKVLAAIRACGYRHPTVVEFAAFAFENCREAFARGIYGFPADEDSRKFRLSTVRASNHLYVEFDSFVGDPDIIFPDPPQEDFSIVLMSYEPWPGVIL